jgi:hypothetical protein
MLCFVAQGRIANSKTRRMKQEDYETLREEFGTPVSFNYDKV